jgi:hypothetical protein
MKPLLWLAAGLLAAGPLRAQSPESEILATIRRVFDGMRAGDSAMARSAFDASARLVSVSTDSAGNPRVNVADIGRFLAAVGRPRTEVWDERIWDTDVRVDAGLASVWTKYAFYRGEQLSHCGVDVFELVRQPDGWKIIHLADTQRRGNCWTPPR